MIFFKNFYFFIFLKFLWAGLILGFVSIFFKILDRVFRHNVYFYNLISFIFYIIFGIEFVYLCIMYYEMSFCWFGLVGMFLGMYLVKISLDFFFTKLSTMLYNKVVKLSLRKKINEQVQSNEKN